MSMTTLDGLSTQVAAKLQGIERYNPENMSLLEKYVEQQVKEPSASGYDLQANLALLKLYQFNPHYFKVDTVAKMMLKGVTALPHSDFVLCKCLLSQEQLEIPIIKNVCYLHELLEMCRFKEFWTRLHSMGGDIVRNVAGFEDAVRRFACHVVGITYAHIQEETLCELLGLDDEAVVNQWIDKNGWKQDRGYVLISNQEEQIKTKKITEKIDLENIATIMAQCF